jgi:GNAT superfamily N-acetyltransferase
VGRIDKNLNTLTPPFEIPGYQVSLLGPETLPALQGLLERCADYSLLVTGEKPGATAAQSMLADCPPGRASEDKAIIGIFDAEDNLLGALDAIRDYPGEDCWWVGLLLIEPLQRNQGLGRRFYQAFEQWVSQLGAKGICLGVVEENEKAYQFWLSLGFEMFEKQPPRNFGKKEHIVITMVHYLSQVKNV